MRQNVNSEVKEEITESPALKVQDFDLRISKNNQIYFFQNA